MKKPVVTRELVNLFPPWSKISSSDQSVGFQLLNSMGLPMDNMEKQLIRMRANQYVSTANLDEIDLTYTVYLPVDFSFERDTTDPSFPVDVAPTVSGVISGVWYPISLSNDNNVENFWYNSIPNRFGIGRIVANKEYDLFTTSGAGMPVTGVYDHHLGGGHLWIETADGTEYLKFSNGNIVRSKIIISGTTRKGTEESETLIFPWDLKQHTNKEWKEITRIEAPNIEDTTQVSVRSADFNNGPYLSPWNMRFSENRNKIDEFWDLGDINGTPTLDRIEHISDEWQQLVMGLSEKQVRESWSLVDDDFLPVTGVDITLQPFSSRAWVVTEDAQLYCYDTMEYTVSGMELIRDRTPGAHVQIELEKPSVVLGEDIIFMPWHARPLKEITRYRLWYQTPSGTKWGLYAGSPMPFTGNFWVIGEQTIQRTVEHLISIPAEEHGEYLLVVEVVYIDGEEQSDKILVPVNYRAPLVSFNLSSLINEPVEGVDFDSDQKLWIKSTNHYYMVDLYTDVMVVDFQQKVIYFKEDYEEVEVDSND